MGLVEVHVRWAVGPRRLRALQLPEAVNPHSHVNTHLQDVEAAHHPEVHRRQGGGPAHPYR